jgi:hypothetical protein
MNATNILRGFTVLLAVALLTALAGPAHAGFTLYDDFAGAEIDPEKWAGNSLEGTFDAPTAETVRAVENGALRVGLVSWGGNASNTGSVRSRQGLLMTQLGTPGTPSFITGLGAKVTVHGAEAQDCAANPESALPSRGRTQIIGAFFNDGSGDVNDRTGDILALIQLQKERTGANQIVAAFVRCSDATCSSTVTTAVPGNPTVFTMGWSLETPLALQFAWDRLNGKFVFTATNPATLATESHDIVYGPTVTNAGPPITDFKRVNVQNDVENCTAARRRTTLDVSFDDVRVHRGSTAYDFGGDGKRDLAAYRPGTGEWFIFDTTTGFQSTTFGAPASSGLGDTPIAADYDGDGKTDLAIYRQATGQWLVFGSTTGFQSTTFGAPASSGLGDIPVPADYDGDGKADLAIYRQATGEWLVFGSAIGFQSTTFGAPASSGLGDIPVPADYDGDGKTDLAIYRQVTGEWLVFGTSTGFKSTAFGAPVSSGLGDTPVPGDFDGDGKADLAIFRASTGEWFVLRSSDGQTQTTAWGGPGDLALPQPAR